MSLPTHRPGGTGVPVRRPPEVIRFGADVTVGGPGVPVLAPPGTGGDVTHVRLADVSSDTPVRSGSPSEPTPLVVEAGGAADLSGIAEFAAAVVLGHQTPDCRSGEQEADRRLAERAAAAGLPIILRLPEHQGEWQGAWDQLQVPNVRLVLVGAADLATLAELKRRVPVPVVADIGDVPELAAVAVAAGADGVWLDGGATAASIGQAREAVTRLAPLVRQVTPDTLAGCREAVDTVDAALATLLEYRVSLAGQIQRLKPVGGHAGRDAKREEAIVARMAGRAPSLTLQHVERIVGEIIAAGLDVAERDQHADAPVWRL